MIEIPAKAPKDIQNVLEQAFRLFWSDTAACANRLRVALELLLDHEKIQHKKKASSGKFYALTLHQRIEILKDQQPGMGENLMALKWLGNKGSHYVGTTSNDLLDAFEILEYCLAEMVGSGLGPDFPDIFE